MKNDCLDELENHMVFILRILEGNEKDISNLEMWYKKRTSDENNPITRNEIQIYNYLKNRMDIFKKKKTVKIKIRKNTII